MKWQSYKNLNETKEGSLSSLEHNLDSWTTIIYMIL